MGGSHLRPAAFNVFQLTGVAQLLFVEQHQPMKQGTSCRDLLKGDARGLVGRGGVAHGLGCGQIGPGLSKFGLEVLGGHGGGLGLARRGGQPGRPVSRGRRDGYQKARDEDSWKHVHGC